jgi:hypothetical protein
MKILRVFVRERDVFIFGLTNRRKKIKYELNYKTTIYIMFEIYHYVEHYNKNNSEFLIPKEECATNIFFVTMIFVRSINRH